MAAGSQSNEKEPLEGESAEPHSVPPRSCALAPTTNCGLHENVTGRRGGI